MSLHWSVPLHLSQISPVVWTSFYFHPTSTWPWSSRNSLEWLILVSVVVRFFITICADLGCLKMILLKCICSFWLLFACDSIYAIAHIRYRLSVCLSHRWMSKTLEVRIMQLSPPGSPMTSFLIVNFTPKFHGEHRERGCQIREG